MADLEINSLASLTLDLPPSCIEFFPINPQYAVIGTYNLQKEDEGGHEPSDGARTGTGSEEKKEQKRDGSLVLLKVKGDEIKILQTLPTASAILDIHFLSHVPSSNFGVATSTGNFAIYELCDWDKESPIVKPVKAIQYFPENVLITAFTWHPEHFIVGMTLSTGQVCLGIIDSEDEDKEQSPSSINISKHDLEAWTLAFLPDASGLLSGGDDSTLRFAELADGSATSMPWADRKIHSAGVTAILPIHLDPQGYLVVTGSYDDHIRLIQTSVSGQRKVLLEINLGGGVWRLKLLERKPSLPAHHGVQKWRSEPPPEELLLLVSCMHAGARVVRFYRSSTEGEWCGKVMARFTEHKSMNYGSDCQDGMNADGKRAFVSTSFYDRLVCLWRY